MISKEEKFLWNEESLAAFQKIKGNAYLSCSTSFPWSGKKNSKGDAFSRVETEKTEGKDFDKDNFLWSDQVVEFKDIDGETSHLDLATNFVDDIKQTYQHDWLGKLERLVVS